MTISTEINPIVDGKPDPGITTSPLSVGMLIDNRYEILDIIGEGGFATIYYAKAKVEGKICESVTLYREAKKAGITDATCKRNAETTLAANGSKCK